MAKEQNKSSKQTRSFYRLGEPTFQFVEGIGAHMLYPIYEQVRELYFCDAGLGVHCDWPLRLKARCVTYFQFSGALTRIVTPNTERNRIAVLNKRESTLHSFVTTYTRKEADEALKQLNDTRMDFELFGFRPDDSRQFLEDLYD